MLRGLTGAAIRPESYARAEIVAGRVGREQAPPGREFICFEPMTGVTNQFNLAHDGKFANLLQTVEPGKKWVESFRVKASGF